MTCQGKDDHDLEWGLIEYGEDEPASYRAAARAA